MATTKKSTETKAETKAAPKKAAPKKTATTVKTDAPKTAATAKKTAKPGNASSIAPSERYKMIEVAAYYIAEKNSFSGNAAEYWVMAEREISTKYPK